MKPPKLPPMRKERVLKPDGRYLIYYRFGQTTIGKSTPPPQPEGCGIMPPTSVGGRG